MKVFTYEKFTCKLGQSAKENWGLFQNAYRNDYFFHLSSFPSGFVILECEDLTPDKVFEAANLCKEYSRYSNLKNISVDYCKISNLKLGKSVGEVIYIKPKKVYQIKV